MKYLYILFFTFLLSACKSDNSSDPETILDTGFYNNYYNLNIAPSIARFKTEITKEIQYLQNFQASQTDEDYELLTSQWLTCAKAFAKVKVYDFGEIEDKFYDQIIHNFPINSTSIETNILDETTFDADYFPSKSTLTKGLGAMEYLIYGDNNTTEAKNLLLENSYRLNYLIGTSIEILRQTNLMIATWENGYADTFINLNGETCSQNATCLSFNQLINILDVTKVTKIGKTAGFESSSNIAPKDLEAYRSRSSLILIEAMLEEVKYAYQESDANFASVVNQIDNSGLISEAIATQFNKIDEVITAFDNNLYDAILTDTSTIEPIYNALAELTILLSVDVTSTLSITVLPTDNDGD